MLEAVLDTIASLLRVERGDVIMGFFITLAYYLTLPAAIAFTAPRARLSYREILREIKSEMLKGLPYLPPLLFITGTYFYHALDLLSKMLFPG